MTNTNQFDKAIQEVTQERGKAYGHPAVQFKRMAMGEDIIRDCQDPAVRHALNMIWVKICRLIETPGHLDSAIDIAGYARTICMVNDYKDES